jgi:hypothetical protein
MTTPPPPDDFAQLVRQMMEAYAADAVNLTRANFGIELDYSPGSVKAVEDLLDRIYPSVRRGWLRKLFRVGLSETEVDRICKMFGGYIGEVVRRKRGGEWQIIQNPLGDENVIALVRGDDTIFPPSKVFKRLTNGKEDDVWFYFLVVTDGITPDDS